MILIWVKTDKNFPYTLFTQNVVETPGPKFQNQMPGIENLVKDKVNITSLQKPRVPVITVCPAFRRMGKTYKTKTWSSTWNSSQKQKKATNLVGKCLTFPVKR